MPAGVVNTSNAVGNAIFNLSEDGTELSYKLIVANIDNAFMAHIHIAPAGVNGPIAVWLYPGTTPGLTAPLGQGRLDGVIAQGVQQRRPRFDRHVPFPTVDVEHDVHSAR